jgi:hypothetical protein
MQQYPDAKVVLTVRDPDGDSAGLLPPPGRVD